jgi:hypothetical protein
MKNKYIKYVTLIFISCCFCACKKQLNVLPTTSEVDGSVIVDAKSATTVLNGVYYRFANAGTDYNSVPTVLWTDIHEVIPSELTGLLSNVNSDDFLAFTLNPKSERVDAIWNYGYNLINAANGFLKNVASVTKIPAAAKKQMIAEATFLRAFGNSELLLYYGQYNNVNSKYGTILRNEFVTSSNINLPRSGVAAVYTSILSDLDAAIADLPALNTQVYYANSSVAKLLKARVLINRGITGDYEEVVNLTNDIISNGPFTLDPNVKDLFLTNGFSSKEVMLGVQPYPSETYKFQNYQYYNQYIAADALVSIMGADPRGQWVFKGTNSPFLGPLNEFTKYYAGDLNNVNLTPLSETCYAFRLTEAYLLQAEAITLSSNGNLAQAKTLLKTVETHAGITDFSAITNAVTASALQLLIVKEELKNFVGENGADWFALRRLPIAAIQAIRPAISSVNQLILPIPESEIITNSQVIQNPGY